VIDFTEIDALDGALYPDLDPRVFVEPKDKGKASEYTRQKEWVAHMRMCAGKVLVFAVPNGTHIASNAGRTKVKAEGLYTGFPDTGCLWEGDVYDAWVPGVAFPEWKDGKGDPSAAQIECLNRLVAMGYPCGIFRTTEVCCNWLRSVGAPVPGVR